jgi:hypothetical protein
MIHSSKIAKPPCPLEDASVAEFFIRMENLATF